MSRPLFTLARVPLLFSLTLIPLSTYSQNSSKKDLGKLQGYSGFFVNQRSIKETKDIYCQSIQRLLSHLKLRPMAGVFVNKESPWFKANIGAFPEYVTTHPVLGNDIATQLPNTQAMLELRTFHLGQEELRQASLLCNLYEKFIDELYRTQIDSLYLGSANSTVPPKYEYKNESTAPSYSLLLDQRINYNHFEFRYLKNKTTHNLKNHADFYTQLGVYFPVSGPFDEQGDKAYSTTHFNDFAGRNYEWYLNLTSFHDRLSSNRATLSTKPRTIPWKFLKPNLWPIHSTQGSRADDVEKRAKQINSSYLNYFQPELADPDRPSGEVLNYWFNLFDSKRNYVVAKNRNDLRNDRFKHFTKILAAELIHLHYQQIPEKLEALKNTWDKSQQSQNQIKIAIAEDNRSFLQNLYDEYTKAHQQKVYKSQMKLKLVSLMRTRGYPPEKQIRILTVWENTQ